MKILALVGIGMLVLASMTQAQIPAAEAQRPSIGIKPPSGRSSMMGLEQPLAAIPGRVNFRMTRIGDEVTERVVIRNTTNSTVDSIDVFMPNPVSSPFSLGGSGCPRVLGARGVCTIRVTYSPSRAQRDRGVVMVRSSIGQATIELSGQGVSP